MFGLDDAAAVSLITGTGALIGSGLNSYYTYSRNKELDRRDDTSIQRRMADLKAAGLNPYLALGQGAGTTTGMTMGLDTSQVGNMAQTAFDLRNQREIYKQNQLYTKMIEDQYQNQRLQSILNNLDFNALLGTDFGGEKKAKYDKFGNLLNIPSFLIYGDDKILSNLNNSPYFNTLKNNQTFNLNQSLFNLKTQGYQNGLELTKETLEPLIQIGNLLNPIGNFYQAINGRKNFNTSNFNGTWTSNNTNRNYNYRN